MIACHGCPHGEICDLDIWLLTAYSHRRANPRIQPAALFHHGCGESIPGYDVHGDRNPFADGWYVNDEPILEWVV